MSDQLLPCPFCGEPSPCLTQAATAGFAVRCKCGGVGPNSAADLVAVAAWNRRPSPWRRLSDCKPVDGQRCVSWEYGEPVWVYYLASEGRFRTTAGAPVDSELWVPAPPEGEGR